VPRRPSKYSYNVGQRKTDIGNNKPLINGICAHADIESRQKKMPITVQNQQYRDIGIDYGNIAQTQIHSSLYIPFKTQNDNKKRAYNGEFLVLPQ
jgi:hypothetical protein